MREGADGEGIGCGDYGKVMVGQMAVKERNAVLGLLENRIKGYNCGRPQSAHGGFYV